MFLVPIKLRLFGFVWMSKGKKVYGLKVNRKGKECEMIVWYK